MRLAVLALTLVSIAIPLRSQENEGPPTNPKAQKTFQEAEQYLHRHMYDAALDGFKKADKQNGGHCLACQKKMVQYGIQIHEWKTAEAGALEMISEARAPKETALAHYEFGAVLLSEGVDKHKDEIFSRAHEEMTAALALLPNFSEAVYGDGLVLAHLKQDDAAKGRFQKFVELRTKDSPVRQRALRYIDQPELARARMAPPFEVTTVSGEKISLDGLQGRVVLIDFWATWCGPCRAALPHVREIAKKFQGQPLVVLSISVDSDESKWREFIAKNEMTWLQYFDGGFTGPVAKAFGVQAIPNTFTIDADGVLQDEHIGDAAIEGKLKKLVKRAQELQVAQKPSGE